VPLLTDHVNYECENYVVQVKDHTFNP